MQVQQSPLSKRKPVLLQRFVRFHVSREGVAFALVTKAHPKIDWVVHLPTKMVPLVGCGIKGFLPTSVMQGNPPFY